MFKRGTGTGHGYGYRRGARSGAKRMLDAEAAVEDSTGQERPNCCDR